VRRLLQLAGVLVLLAFALVAALLGHAHWAIRGLGAPLPTDLSALDSPDAPVRISWINTSRQAMPRTQVLDPGKDPTPDRPYVMGHPAFVLGWADGRRLLVDVGMEPDAALAFGRNIEPFGAAPAEAHGAAADRVPELASGPLGVVFTHLHVDHVQGIGALCARRAGAEVLVFSTPAQADRRNYTTQPAAGLLAAAPCARVVRLPESPLAPLPGFPGVAVIWAAGHTPDAQVVLAAVARDGAAPQRIAFAGDVVNAVDGARFDVPKPFLYRWLVVPEDDVRLGAVRRFLGHLEQAGFVLAPAHDLLHLRSLGLGEIAGAAGGAGG
jgi:glyoxylase-like metal-dependent hydrolase (beta-lactamase superfamily II)